MHLEIECQETEEILETDKMNPLELACARGHLEIIKYFVEELNLKSRTDFNMAFTQNQIEQMPFIYAPILLKNADVFELLLNLPAFWTYDDLSEVLLFIKHVKWLEGYQIFFRSHGVR